MMPTPFGLLVGKGGGTELLSQGICSVSSAPTGLLPAMVGTD
jgi:hypothetical protein